MAFLVGNSVANDDDKYPCPSAFPRGSRAILGFGGHASNQSWGKLLLRKRLSLERVRNSVTSRLSELFDLRSRATSGKRHLVFIPVQPEILPVPCGVPP